MSQTNRKNIISRISIVTILVIVIVTALYMYMCREQAKTQSFQTEAELSPNEFMSLFDSINDNQAKDYVDKAIEIKGVLKKVTKRDERYTLFINSTEEGRFIQCEMQADQIEKIKNIQTEDLVTIKGIFKGVLLDAILLNCIIID